MNFTKNLIQNKEQISHAETIHGWRVHFYDTVGSTNDVARDLTPWNAVRAGSQSLGRGRYGRLWVSDTGGLWLSMVVPVEGESRRWKALPLAAGWAIVRVIKGLGIWEARLRWPNDIMINDLKLGGVLVEQFREGTAVVGVGINVVNRPDRVSSELTQAITRLSDSINPVPSLDELTALILNAMGNVHQHMRKNGFSVLARRVNTAWGEPRRVELELDGGIHRGLFMGINEYGDPIIKNDAGNTCRYSPLQVKRFREIEKESMLS